MKRAVLGRLALAAAGALLLAGCSTAEDRSSALGVATSAPPVPTPTAASTQPTPTPTPVRRESDPQPYERAVLADGAVALWPLRDVPPQMTLGDTAIDLRGRVGPAVNADGRVDRTRGPAQLGPGAAAASFRNSGRLVTPLTKGLSSKDAFTIELWFRADGCSSSWGRIAGTEVAGVDGREGVNLFHYPVGSGQACRFGAEVWEGGRFLVGCPTGAPLPVGTWRHLAVTWSSGRLVCFVDGRAIGGQVRAGATFRQAGPFGIGATGTGDGGKLGAGSVAQVAVYAKVVPTVTLRSHATGKFLNPPPSGDEGQS